MRSGAACARPCAKRATGSPRSTSRATSPQTLAELKPDVAFNALHGKVGEDGTIQGVLEMLRIPYTHSGVLASALAMNKQQAKIVMAAAGVPIAEGMVVDRHTAARAMSWRRPTSLNQFAKVHLSGS